MNTTSMKKAAALSVGAAMLVTGLGLQPANADDTTSDTGTTQSSVMAAAATSTDITQIGSATVKKFRNGGNTQDIKATVDGKTQDGDTVSYWSGIGFTISLHTTINQRMNAGDSVYIKFNAMTGSKFNAFSSGLIDPVVKDAAGETLYTVAWDKNVPGVRLTATEAGAKLASSEFTLQLLFQTWTSNSNTSTHSTWTIGGSTIEFDNAAMPTNTISNYNGSYTSSEGSGNDWFDGFLAFRSDGLINDALAGKNNTEAWKTAANRKRVMVAHVTANNAPLNNLSTRYFDEYMLKAYDATHVGSFDDRSTFDQLAIHTVTVDSADQINTVEKATTSLPNRGDVAIYHDTDGSWWIAANMGALTEGVTAPSNNWTDETTKNLYANMKPLGLGAQVSRFRFVVNFSVDNLPQSANVEYWGSTGSHGTYTVKNKVVNNETADGVKLGWIGFESNGGTGSMDTKTGGVDSKLTLPANAFTRTGYEFTGWNTKADGSGTAYKVGDQVQYTETGVTLFAQWKGLPATVSVNANGGSGSATKLTGVTGQIVKTPAASGFTKTGYTLTGWNTKADGSGRTYAPNADMPLPAGDTSIYAVWTANAASITYKANNGSGTAPTTNGVTDQTVQTAVNTFTRTGYTFTGWNTKADGSGVAYAAGADVKLPAGGLTLYAQWKANAASITYNGNNGSGTTNATNGVTDQTVKAAANAFTRTGYTFTGWNTRADGTGIAYAANADVKLPAGGLTLYAQWKANAASITYDGNTGTGTTAKTTGVTDQSVKVAANAFTKTGYTFTGWNTKKDGSGSAYAAGTTLKLPAGGLALYAQWKANAATITYDGNKGTGTVAATNGVTDQNVKVAANAFTRTGYTFTGWNTRADGTGTAYAANADLKLPAGGLTLFAQWKANAASITYDGNTGTGTVAATTGVTDQTVKVAANAFTRTGYTFTGWNSKADGSGVAYAANADLKLPAGGVKLFAQWKANKATISYIGNNGTGTMPDTNGVTGDNVTIAANAFTRAGYTFTGWNSKADGSGTAYAAGASLKLPANGITLYAQWKANVAAITYDGNTGTGTTAKTSGVTDQTVKVAANAFTKTGYTFTGWNTKADGSGVAYAAGVDLKLPAGGLTLFAQWKANAAAVTYQPNHAGVTGSTVATDGVTGQSVTIAVNGYQLNGYTFVGWNTQADGKGTMYQPGVKYTLPAGGVKLFAQWKANAATLSYDANGGTGTTVSYTGVTDGQATVAANAFTRNGYTFTGWNSKADGSGTKYAAGASLKLPAGGVKLFAQWKADAATLSYDANGGKGVTVSTKGVTDGTVKAAVSGFTRAGYEFKGWNTKANGTGIAYAAGADVQLPAGGMTLYAMWVASPSTVGFDANGGEGTVDPIQTVTDQTITLPDAGFTRAGWTFTGWNTKADGTGVGYAPSAVYKAPAGGVTLYAQWSGNEASIVFNANGGSGSVSELKGKAGESVTAPDNAFTREGWKFLGWSLSKDDSGQLVKPGERITLTGLPVTMYAIWKAEPMIVHYDFNASAVTGEIADQAFTDDQPGTVTDKVPVRAGYTFLGWNTQKDGKGVSYPTGVQIPSQPGQTVTLFAQWKADKASVSFDRNAADATGSTPALAGATDDLKKLPENGFTRDGYTFKGWNTKADGSGVSYKPGDEFTLHGDVTLYAQWAVKTPIATALANTGASVVGAMTALLLTAGAGVALLLRRTGRTERKH